MLGKQQYYVSLALYFDSWFKFVTANPLFVLHLDRLQNDSEENIQTIPTIGFNVEVLQYKNIKFQVSVCACSDG